MKTTLALCLFVLPSLAFADVTLGMSEAELLAFKGKPAGTTVVGTKAIYRWADLQVKLEDGKVVQIAERNTAKEKAGEEQRRKNIEFAAEQKKAAAAKEAAIAERTRIAEALMTQQTNQQAVLETERLNRERAERERSDKAAAEDRARMRRY